MSAKRKRPVLRADLYAVDPADHSEVRAAVLETIRRSGCDCEPGIEISGVPPELAIRIYHDDGCAHPAMQ